MKILHVVNRHRGGGGADNACDDTIRLSRAAGLQVCTLERDSRDIPRGLRGKVGAFASGVYGRDALAELASLLDREQPDIVHTHELFPLVSPWALKLCAQRGIPVVHACYDFRITCPIATHVREGSVCTDCLRTNELAAVRHNCRGNSAESAAYAIRNAVARRARLYGYVDRFIVLTQFSRQWLERNAGISRERITINAPAVEIPPEEADPGSGSYVAYAGRFVPEKGVELLIEAARAAGLPLRLAGNEPVHPAVRAMDDVQCVLTPTRDDLMRFYRGARMLVVPSLWFETFGLVAAEAMAHGMPVVASRIGALQDTVQDGETGLLFAVGDAGDLASKMRRLWDDPSLTRSLGSAARAHAKRQFSGAAYMRRLIGTYESVLRGTSRSAA